MNEEKKLKWYLSLPVITILTIFCFPISLILLLIRLTKIKDMAAQLKRNTLIYLVVYILYMALTLWGMYLMLTDPTPVSVTSSETSIAIVETEKQTEESKEITEETSPVPSTSETSETLQTEEETKQETAPSTEKSSESDKEKEETTPSSSDLETIKEETKVSALKNDSDTLLQPVESTTEAEDRTKKETIAETETSTVSNEPREETVSTKTKLETKEEQNEDIESLDLDEDEIEDTSEFVAESSLDKVYSLETYPYDNNKVLKKALKKLDKPESGVYLSPDLHLFSSKESFEQSTQKTNYLYYGDIKKGRPDGEGIILKYDLHSECYIPMMVGEFKNGELDGYGYFYSEISVGQEPAIYLLYEGGYKDGLYSGAGKEYGYPWGRSPQQLKYYQNYTDDLTDNDYIESDEYTVFWKIPLVAGEILYDGKYKKGLMNGKGVLYCERHSDYIEYEGEYKNGKRHGKGKEYYPMTNTLKYSGQFKNDKYDGKGELYTEDGKLKYKGKFKNGLYE